MKDSKRKPNSRSRNVETGPFLSQLIEDLKKHVRFAMLIIFLFAVDAVILYLLGNRWIAKILIPLSNAYAIKTALEIFFGITFVKS